MTCRSCICRLGQENTWDCTRSSIQKLFTVRAPVSSCSCSSAIVWIKANQWCGKKMILDLKVSGEDFDWSSNRVQKAFDRMGHGRLVGGGSNLEFLPEFCQLKEHCFEFVGYISRDIKNVLNDFIDRIFECLNWFNWCVIRHRGGSVGGNSIRMRDSGRWVQPGRIRDS